TEPPSNAVPSNTTAPSSDAAPSNKTAPSNDSVPPSSTTPSGSAVASNESVPSHDSPARDAALTDLEAAEVVQEGAANPAAAAARGVAPLWRNRDYAGWWVSSLISSLGSSMSQLAYPLLMLYATGSVARAGIVGACLNIGGLSTTLLGGALADHYSRRRLA